jgi:hypothetical protein
MAKRKQSTRKSARPSTKTRGTAAAKSAAVAKSTTRPARKKPRTTAHASKARKTLSPLATTVDRCVTTVDGWRKQCAGKLHSLVHQRAKSKSRRRNRSHRKTDLRAVPQWLATSAKRVGSELRNIELDDVKKFCQREWHELVVMARKLDQLANHTVERAKRQAK